MLTLEYKLDGKFAQYAAITEGIRVVQFLRNKCIRAWMDRTDAGKSMFDMTAYTAVFAIEYKAPAGWKLEPDGKHIIFSDGLGIGRMRLIGTRSVATFPEKLSKK